MANTKIRRHLLNRVLYVAAALSISIAGFVSSALPSYAGELLLVDEADDQDRIMSENSDLTNSTGEKNTGSTSEQILESELFEDDGCIFPSDIIETLLSYNSDKISVDAAICQDATSDSMTLIMEGKIWENKVKPTFSDLLAVMY